MCSSSGASIVSLRHLVYVTLYRCLVWYAGLDGTSIQVCILDGHLYRVTYTRCRVGTIDSPDDEHIAARNTYRTEINI